MSIFNDRMGREAKTIKAMVKLYCKHHHDLNVDDCGECSVIQAYALDRLYHCPFQEGKTSCKKCPIHCYKPDMKEEVRKVMRYSGPRMMLRHPLLTIFHLIDDRQEEPVRPESIGQDTKTSKTECPGPASSFKPSLEESSPKN